LQGTPRFFTRLLVIVAAAATLAHAVTVPKKKKASAKAARRTHLRRVSLAVAGKSAANRPVLAVAKNTKPAVRNRSPWRSPNYADSTLGDVTTGEDPIARQAAVQALGKLNGSVVISDANTGRILAMVNQKLALQSGFQPCSTVKVPVALAALSEGVVNRDTRIRLYGRTSMDMTQALAHSSNQYFASCSGSARKPGWTSTANSPGSCRNRRLRAGWA
jgi:penicillin-binding protein 2